jgi:hypothetical protein
MGFKICAPSADRAGFRTRPRESASCLCRNPAPLNTNEATLDTIKQIDVLWLRRGLIVRAFEVEHTTAVYSGLFRMADLLALQPNMDIRLHIVAPDERREKVFRRNGAKWRGPYSCCSNAVFYSNNCMFISYETVDAIRGLKHLAHINDASPRITRSARRPPKRNAQVARCRDVLKQDM